MGRLPYRANETIGATIRLQPLPPPPATFDMADPRTILTILKGLAVVTTTLYHAIDKALELEHEEQQTLKDLSSVVEGLKSDTAVYETLLKAMADDPQPYTISGFPYSRFIQRWVTGL